ncbi:MAG: DJ-1/PfpI family protein [Candidatus Eremiobacteraeota bacterium]|nr:DJ-1/PfpI family protein [Candidatus Eremiobacteraeota bacterium]
MRRRDLLVSGAVALAAVAAPAAGQPLALPHGRAIRVAFLAGELSNLIDIAGPAEVFQDTWAGATFAQTVADTHGPFLSRPNMPFSVFIVCDATSPIQVGPHLRMLANYSLDTAPQPDVIVVGAQSTPSAAKLDWLRQASKGAALTMSVCTGAFTVAEAGLFDGLRATTHHAFYDVFAKQFPKVRLVRNVRYVDEGRFASAGGLTSGIDLALHVVARYFGEAAANQTANWMEFTRMTARPTTMPQ